MSKLDELRKRSEAKRAERENIYRQAVGEAVQRVMSDSNGIITLNAISQGGASVFKDAATTDHFVERMVDEVTTSITNPVDNFILTCRNRGLTDRRIKIAVARIYEMYFEELKSDDTSISDEVPYEKKIEAVAAKLELEQQLWDELQILQRVD